MQCLSEDVQLTRLPSLSKSTNQTQSKKQTNREIRKLNRKKAIMESKLLEIDHEIENQSVIISVSNVSEIEIEDEQGDQISVSDFSHLAVGERDQNKENEKLRVNKQDLISVSDLSDLEN